MSDSVRILPNGGYDHVGINYVSSYTAAQKIIIRTAATSGTNYAAFNPTTLAIETDKVNEFTSAAGVTVDSVLLKDGGATLTAGLIGTTATLSGALSATTGTFSGAVSAASVAGSNIFINSTGSFMDLRIGGTNVLTLVASAVTPGIDNSIALGSGSYRFASVTAQKFEAGGATTFINTAAGNNIDFTVNNSMVWRITAAGLLTPAVRPDYTLGTWSLARTLPNTSSATTQQVADTLASLIADLVALGFLQ